MVHIKSNLAAAGPASIYELTDKINWIRQEDIDPDDLFGIVGTDRKKKFNQAEDMLIEWLSEKDLPAKEIESRFKEHGISYRTVTDAKKALGIRNYRSGNQSVWSLPEELRNNADVAVDSYE